jgi:hypothetical protein
MHGAVFGTIIVAVAIILLAGMTPILIIPIVVIGLGALVAIPMLTAAQGTSARPTGAAPSGVPSTSEASYQPVSEPGEQRGA